MDVHFVSPTLASVWTGADTHNKPNIDITALTQTTNELWMKRRSWGKLGWHRVSQAWQKSVSVSYIWCTLLHSIRHQCHPPSISLTFSLKTSPSLLSSNTHTNTISLNPNHKTISLHTFDKETFCMIISVWTAKNKMNSDNHSPELNKCFQATT